MSSFWQTAISQVKTNEILVRGYPIEQLVRRSSFGQVVYLLLKGELPAGAEGKLVEAMVVACCEHSLLSPSADTVRFVASCGVPLQTAVGAGVLAIGDVHGGAIEPFAHILHDALEAGKSAEQVVTELRGAGKRVPGMGHPIHKPDPRRTLLFDLAKELNLFGPHSQLALEFEAATETVIGRRIDLNVDGAIAALMCDMKIDPALGKSFFILGRTAGFVAHAHEQMTQERPFKAAPADQIVYTGPPRRDVPPGD